MKYQLTINWDKNEGFYSRGVRKINEQPDVVAVEPVPCPKKYQPNRMGWRVLEGQLKGLKLWDFDDNRDGSIMSYPMRENYDRGIIDKNVFVGRINKVK